MACQKFPGVRVYYVCDAVECLKWEDNMNISQLIVYSKFKEVEIM